MCSGHSVKGSAGLWYTCGIQAVEPGHLPATSSGRQPAVMCDMCLCSQHIAATCPAVPWSESEGASCCRYCQMFHDGCM